MIGGGLLLLLLGTLVPAHLREVDREVLQLAGRDSPTLQVEAERALAGQRAGAARLMLEAARGLGVAGAEPLRADDLVRSNRQIAPWGGPSPWLDRHAAAFVPDPTGRPPATLAWIMPEEVRASLLAALSESTHPVTRALLGCRELESTRLLPPVSSASGQPLDAALMLAGALVEAGRMHPSFMLELERGAIAAARGEDSMPIESALLELLAAASRLNWEQLASLMQRTEDRFALKTLVARAGSDGGGWPELFAAVVLNGGARGVAGYIDRHGDDALADLRASLPMGAGAVQELVRRGDPVRHARVRTAMIERLGMTGVRRLLARSAVRAPGLSLAVKYLLWVDGIFLVLAGLWYARHEFLEETNRRFEPRPDFQRLLVVTAAAAVLLFLTAEGLLVLRSGGSGSGGAMPFPMFTAQLRLDVPQVRSSDMNEKVIAMLAAFFVIQLAIYMLGLGRLRYIRAQMVDGPVKLRLLDNEEPMFDAPLYVGIGGSVLALVMRLTGFDEVSLMASYSSTLFGILFCFVLKVMHVRPYRQRLILESVEGRAS